MKNFLIFITIFSLGTVAWSDDGEALAKQKACLGCHTVQHIGISYPPALAKVAEKYRNDPDHIRTVIRNGKGKMPAHPTLTDAEINLLTNYILNLAN